MDEQTAPVGDWQLRGLDADQKLAQTPMRDDCIDALNRTQRRLRKFSIGPKLYWRLVRCDTCFDRDLAASAISLARSLTRAKKLNGHSVVARRGRRNNWIAQCGIDALEFAIRGEYSESAEARADALEVDSEVYRRVRQHLALCLAAGLSSAAHEFRYQLLSVERENRELGHVREAWEGFENARYVTAPKKDSDNCRVSQKPHVS